LDEAIAEFRAAIAVRDGYALAHLNLSAALRRKNDADGAEAELRRACAVDTKVSAECGPGSEDLKI